MQIKSKEIGKKHFDVFNLAEIDTTIESVEIAFKGTKIRLSDGRQFVFFPFTDEILNNSSIFNFTAQEGDRLKKDNAGGKYIYDPVAGQFKNAPAKINDLLKNP